MIDIVTCSSKIKKLPSKTKKDNKYWIDNHAATNFSTDSWLCVVILLYQWRIPDEEQYNPWQTWLATTNKIKQQGTIIYNLRMTENQTRPESGPLLQTMVSAKNRLNSLLVAGDEFCRLGLLSLIKDNNTKYCQPPFINKIVFLTIIYLITMGMQWIFIRCIE